ncbi:MAG TPA: dihydrofolate reductase family protein [Jatrophihabitantaceae bacterium]
MTAKLTVAALLTLDGVHDSPRSFAGPYFDDDAAARSLVALESCAAMLMGRTTYEYFAPAWSAATDPYSARVNGITKYVFSSTLTDRSWSNTRVVAGDPVAAVADLKRQADGDLMIYGYGQLSQTLLEHGLVDELKLSIFPVVAGSGIPVFRPGKSQALRLSDTKTWRNGTIELTYTPVSSAG